MVDYGVRNDDEFIELENFFLNKHQYTFRRRSCFRIYEGLKGSNTISTSGFRSEEALDCLIAVPTCKLLVAEQENFDTKIKPHKPLCWCHLLGPDLMYPISGFVG
ncbi:hypothetical protein ACU8KH_02261 [Lachancea thermotolerans]